MAKQEEKVMQFVRAELEANPDVETSELFERAKKVDAGVRKLSLRQFNARFPLQIKRRKSMSGSKRRRRSKPSGGGSRSANVKNREAVREIFLRFASDLSSADERKDLVHVISRVDRYVDEAIKAGAR